MGISTITDTAECSSSKSNNTSLHARQYASNNNYDSSSHRNNRHRRLWRYLQQLVRNQRNSKWGHHRHGNDLHSTYSGRTVSTGDSNQTSWSCGTHRNRQDNHNKRYYYFLIGLLTVGGPALAEDVYNNAAPESTATGNVTNQAVQFQNNGAPSRQQYGSGIVCNGPTMTLSPFYMGNDSVPHDYESYVKSNQWGAQLNFMVPLDWSTINRCKSIAKRKEQKMQLDYELVRALKCAELQQKGFTFRPGSRVEHMCYDVIPISTLLTKTND